MQLDEAAPNGAAIRSLHNVWVTLTVAEATVLAEVMRNWEQQNAAGELGGGWHEHLRFDESELTFEVLQGDDEP